MLYSSVPHRVRLTTEPLCLIHIVHGGRAPGCFKHSIVGSCPNTGRPSHGYPDLVSLACRASYIITLMSLCSRVMNGTENSKEKYEINDICQTQRGGELWCEARLHRHVRVPCAWSLAWLEATDPRRGACTRTLLLRPLPPSLELTIIYTFFAAVMLRCLHTRVHVQYSRH